MQIDIPYTYEITGIPNRCRKPRQYEFGCAAAYPGEVREISVADAPIAFRLTGLVTNHPATPNSVVPGSLELRWFGSRLWKPAWINQTGPKIPLDAFHLIAETQNALRLQPSQWIRTSEYDGYWTTDRPQLKTEVFKTITRNNELELIRKIQSRLDAYLLMDGVFYVNTYEPFYVVKTFGLGANHGSTALFATHYFHRDSQTLAFRADELPAAIAAATKIAEKRGDTKSLPIEPIQHIEVLIPEAVTMHPDRMTPQTA